MYLISSRSGSWRWLLQESWNSVIMKTDITDCTVVMDDQAAPTLATPGISYLVSRKLNIFCLKLYKWTSPGQKWTPKVVTISENHLTMKTIDSETNASASSSINTLKSFNLREISIYRHFMEPLRFDIIYDGAVGKRFVMQSLDRREHEYLVFLLSEFEVSFVPEHTLNPPNEASSRARFASVPDLGKYTTTSFPTNLLTNGEGQRGSLRKVFELNKILLGDLLDHCRSLFWFTYRAAFPDLEGFSSDAGWGCMHRTGQCLVSEAFRRLLRDQGKQMVSH